MRRAPIVGSASAEVQVAIRVRPLNELEKSTPGCLDALEIGDSFLVLRQGESESTFAFDSVFGQTATTLDMYEKIAHPIVSSCLMGVNGTIFAYGQTASGKTFTMQGRDEHPGILRLAAQRLFEPSDKWNVSVTVSYIEIYNERIKDLLSTAKSDTSGDLKVREDPQKGFFVDGVVEASVSSYEQILARFAEGERRRHVAGTDMNEKSSRSHTIFMMSLSIKPTAGNTDPEFMNGTLRSRLSLVDLAGSENVRNTNAEGERLKEGGQINKSLLTLSMVISSLAKGREGAFVKFRDSKLTQILQPSLVGNCRTAVICCVTPASIFANETLSTLKFANSAKHLKTEFVVNQMVDQSRSIKSYQEQIRAFQTTLQNERLAYESLAAELEDANSQKLSLTKQLEEFQEDCKQRSILELQIQAYSQSISELETQVNKHLGTEHELRRDLAQALDDIERTRSSFERRENQLAIRLTEVDFELKSTKENENALLEQVRKLEMLLCQEQSETEKTKDALQSSHRAFEAFKRELDEEKRGLIDRANELEEKLNQSLSASKDQKRSSDESIELLQNRAEQADTRARSLLEDLNQARDDLRIMGDRANSLDLQLNDCRQELDAMRAENSCLNGQLTDIRHQLDDLQSLYQGCLCDLSRYKEESEQLKKALDIESQERDDVQRKVQQLTLEIELANDKEKETSSFRVDLERKLEEIKGENSSMQETILLQQRSLDICNEELENLRQLLKGKDENALLLSDESAELRKQLENSSQNHVKVLKENDCLSSKLSSLENEHGELRSEYQKALDELADVRDDVSRLKSSLSGTESQNENIRDKCKALEVEVVALSSSNSGLQVEVESLRETLKITQGELEGSTMRYQELEIENNNLSADIQEVRLANESLEAELDAATKTLGECQANLSRMENELVLLKTHMSDLDKENMHLREELLRSNEECEERNMKYDHGEEYAETLCRRIDDLRDENIRLVEQLFNYSIELQDLRLLLDFECENAGIDRIQLHRLWEMTKNDAYASEMMKTIFIEQLEEAIESTNSMLSSERAFTMIEHQMLESTEHRLRRIQEEMNFCLLEQLHLRNEIEAISQEKSCVQVELLQTMREFCALKEHCNDLQDSLERSQMEVEELAGRIEVANQSATANDESLVRTKAEHQNELSMLIAQHAHAIEALQKQYSDDLFVERSKVNSAKESLDALSSELERANAEVKALTTKQCELGGQSELQLSTIQQLHSDKAKLNELLAVESADKAELLDYVSQLKSLLDCRNVDLTSAHLEMEGMVLELSRLEGSLAEKHASEAVEVQRLKEELKDAVASKHEIEDELMGVRQDISCISEKLQTEQDNVSKFETTICERDEQLRCLQTTLEQYDSTIAELHNELSQSSALLSQAKEDSKVQSEQLRLYTEEIKAVSEKLERFEANEVLLQRKCLESERRIEELVSDLDQLHKEKQELLASNESLNITSSENVSKLVSELQTTKATLASVLSDSELTRTEAQSQLTSLRTVLSDLEAEHNNLRDNLENANAARRAADEALKEALARTSSTEENLRSVESKLATESERYSADLESLKLQLAEANSALHELSAAVTEKDEQYASLAVTHESEIAALKNEVEHAKNEALKLHQVTVELDQACNEIRRLQSEHIHDIERIQTEKDETMAKLNLRLVSAESGLDHLRKCLSEAENALAEERGKLAGVLADHEQQASDSAPTSENVADLEEALREYEKEIVLLKQRNEFLEANKMTKQAKVEVENLKEECRRLRAENARLHPPSSGSLVEYESRLKEALQMRDEAVERLKAAVEAYQKKECAIEEEKKCQIRTLERENLMLYKRLRDAGLLESKKARVNPEAANENVSHN